MPTDIELKIGLSDSDKATMKTQISSDVLNEIVNGEVNVSGSKTNLTKLKASVDEAVGSIENKVEPDDICPELRAGYAFTADNLNATKGLTVSDDPMSFGAVGGAQKSAVGDGNASLNKLVCVDVARNQLVHMETIFPTQVEIAESLTKFTVLTADTETYVRPNVSFTNGHIYFVVSNVIRGTLATLTYWLNDAYEQSIDLKSAAMQLLSYTRSNGTGGQLVVNGSAGATASLCVIDLTQRYGNNEVVNAIIGTTTSEQVARLLAFAPEILSDTAHDAGTLVPSKSAKLVSKGKDGNVLGTVTLPNHEGHGILKVVDGKVVADGDELYPDGKGKRRWREEVIGDRNITKLENFTNVAYARVKLSAGGTTSLYKDGWSSKYGLAIRAQGFDNAAYVGNMVKNAIYDEWWFGFPVGTTLVDVKSALVGTKIIERLATEQDISTPVFQSTFPVEQGGTLQFLDENDKPIAGLQGSEVFYQKNIKAFVEALGEATDWNPERIKRLGSLSFTPEYVNIALNPSPTGAYARAQVYNATFTIVISAPLTGTANGSISFQDSEVDLSNFQTKPAEAIYDMDGKKVSEEPKTADCNIASFVGRSKGGTIMWSLLHSGVNKVKIHIEDAVPLDSDGKGKIDCRASLIL